MEENYIIDWLHMSVDYEASDDYISQTVERKRQWMHYDDASSIKYRYRFSYLLLSRSRTKKKRTSNKQPPQVSNNFLRDTWE